MSRLKPCSQCMERWQKESKLSEKEKSPKHVFSVCDVSLHDQRNDCWLIAHGIVYDVTDFLSQHPGGSQSILMHAGKRVDDDFDFHPREAQKMWNQYRIGTLESCLNSSTGCIVS